MPVQDLMLDPIPSKEDVPQYVSEYNELSQLPALRKNILLFFLCLAQFLDTFANSALFAAIPPIATQLHISNSDSVWLISGYQLTFSSLLLIVSPAYTYIFQRNYNKHFTERPFE